MYIIVPFLLGLPPDCSRLAVDVGVACNMIISALRYHSLFAEGRFKISPLDGKLDVEQSLLRHVEHEPLMMLQSLRRCLHHQLTLRVIATLT